MAGAVAVEVGRVTDGCDVEVARGRVRLAFASCTSVGFVLVVAAVVVTGAAVMGVPAEGAAALDTGAAVEGTGAAVLGIGTGVALGWAAVVTGAAVVVAGAKVTAGAWVLIAGPAVLIVGTGLLVGTAAVAAAGAEAGTGPVLGGHSVGLLTGSTSASRRPGTELLRATAWRRGMCRTWQQRQTGAPQCSEAAQNTDAGFYILLKVWEQSAALSGTAGAAKGLTWSADDCGAVYENAALLKAPGSDVSF